MSRDEQIEEMAKDIEEARIKATDTTNSMNYGFGGWYAKELYTKGYRKATDVAEEIFAEIWRAVIIDIPEYSDCRKAFNELKKKYTEGGNDA